MSNENREKAKQELNNRIGLIPEKKGVWIVGMISAFLLSSFVDDSLAGADTYDIMMDLIVGGICGFFCIKHLFENYQNKRFESYILRLGGPDIVIIDDLANSMGYSKKRVLKDLRAMISKGVLMQAHIDPDEKYLFMTHEIFQEYMQGLSERAVAEKKKQWIDPSAANQAKKEEEPDELKKTLIEGREYIRKIKLANKKIPGEEITRKLKDLEDNCEQIFSIVESHPEKLGEIRKFMDYYMPTTVKLVNNYADFTTGKAKGNNIEKVKKEIEESLDMINLAFSNLSNRLYEVNTMDVSSDITVLKTMLAQEGLNEKDFDIK